MTISDLKTATLPFELLQTQENFFKYLVSSSKSINTVKNYKTDLNCFNEFLEIKQGNFHFNDFNLTKVEEYAKFLEEKYTSTNSRRRRVQTLRIFFDFLISRNVVLDNPVKKISPSPKFLDIPRPVSLENVEIIWNHLLNETKNKSTTFGTLLAYRNLIIMMLIYGCGLKVSDLSVLQKKHIFLGKSPRIMINPPKRDPYTIPLPDTFVKIYSEYLKLKNKIILDQKQIKSENESNTLSLEIEEEFSHLLFNANHYRVLAGGLSPRGLEIIFEELKRKLKISITPKNLRQSCIFKWIHQEHSESQIKEWISVAPSYTLKPYLEHSKYHYFNDHFFNQDI